MTQYAKYISETEIEYPQASAFIGIPNWQNHDVVLRRKGFVPLHDIPEGQEGYKTVLDKFSLTEQKITRTEPRREDPVTHEPFMEDIMEEDPETHEMKKVGEQQVTREVPVEFDDSFITVLEYHYEELPPPPPPPEPEQPSEEVRQATAAIINRIAKLVIDYNAVEDAKALDNFNIENMLALAQQKGVTPEDMASLKEDLVLLKTDLEGKMDATWYQIWNGWLKGAIADALQNITASQQE